MVDSPVHSGIIVISWWSNCLALTCLHDLVQHAPDRQVSVVQVGKSEEQKERFRALLPPTVKELFYPQEVPAEHSRVIQEIVFRQRKSEPGLWFIDHDVFFQSDCEDWLGQADGCFSQNAWCLCLRSDTQPSPNKRIQAITQPAFWVSPARWPAAVVDTFDTIPFQARPEARRPDLFRSDGKLILPEKDTLVQARDLLAADPQGPERVGYFPLKPAEVTDRRLPPFPAHIHLGGLPLFTCPILPSTFDAWMRTTVTSFARFFEACPAEWLAAEDAELLRRLDEFQGALHV